MLGIGDIDWDPNYPLLFILILPFFISLVILRRRISAKNNVVKAIIWVILSGLPIIIFIYSSINEQSEKERWYVGTYSLEKYPNCPNCKLILSWDNTYVITSSIDKMGNGEWRYVPHKVYPYVELNQSDQLGNGKFQYNKFEPNYPE